MERSYPSACTSLCLLGLGAAASYLFDPDLGRRRRAIGRDKLRHYARELACASEVAGRDLAHRAQGLLAEMRKALRHESVDDRTIEQRVRSQLGRHVAHARAVHVRSAGGIINLSGPVEADEADALVSAVRAIPGVIGINNNLHVADEPIAPRGGTPARRPRGRQTLTPAERGLAVAGGTFLALWGLSNRSLPGKLLALGGGTLLWRAMTDGADRIEVRKSLDVGADVSEVFGFFSNYDNFPLFMRNVKRVCDHGDGRSRWTVVGPAGLPVEWDAVITDFVPHERIAWRTLDGAAVQHDGDVRFLENYDGGTRIEIRLSYHPPAGRIGHAVASLFGADPRTEMNEDLARLKTLIERGRFPHDAARHLVAR